MVQATSTIIAHHLAGNITGSVRCIAVNLAAVGVEVIIRITTRFGYLRCRHLLVTCSRFVCIVTCSRRIVLREVAEILASGIKIVTESLDHTTVLTRESATAHCVSTLIAGEDGLLGLQEVVVLHEHAGTRSSTYAILGHVVEVVVPDVYAHGTNARMARVRVVEPVVVVADPVGAALALHAEHVGLTRIPIVVVAYGDVL